MTMRLSELIEYLQDVQRELRALASDDNTEAVDPKVYGAIQPNYPIAVELDTVTLHMRGERNGKPQEPVVWLAWGSSPYDINPYAPRGAWAGNVMYDDEPEEE